MRPSRRDDEAVLARLAAGGEGAFLAPHHLAAAQRFERLVRRAQMVPRVTMSYDPARLGTRKGSPHGVAEASDNAAAARLALSRLAGALPPDCWGVLFDVCGLGKGLQLIETERRWPRRSAKLVLRIALEQLAARFGLAEAASGGAPGAIGGWLGERLPLIGEDAP